MFDEMEAAIATETEACSKTAWVAEPGLPSLPPEVTAVAKQIVDSVPRSHMDEWAIGNFRAVEREMTAKRRRVEAESAKRRLLFDLPTVSMLPGRKRALPSASMVEATKKRLNALTASMIAPAKLAAKRTLAELSLKDKHRDDWDKELKKCWALLESLAETSSK